jgi:hypothetical protein
MITVGPSVGRVRVWVRWATGVDFLQELAVIRMIRVRMQGRESIFMRTVFCLTREGGGSLHGGWVAGSGCGDSGRRVGRFEDQSLGSGFVPADESFFA